ncbi:hypothetical protein CNE_BB1p03650 (plasmid) [Cupriavidus necator N-1]|jgi:hypothetical protein|uniref:Uncharacterized protein n=1 Tax=Cupriavidus necator (strain ATCC 43291 / DSM 13513 / CCUG 52238 / LMG 8453 / N-1) TaxID=1042878 RepID=F8GWR9_CUPNN|nr:hypothetical protein CNE_BB1p03650 [Cupriavidus necator N-1]
MGLAALVAAIQARRAGEAFRDVRLLTGVSAACALAGLMLAMDLMGWNA